MSFVQSRVCVRLVSFLEYENTEKIQPESLMTMRSDLDLHGSKPGVFFLMALLYRGRPRHSNLVFIIIIGPLRASNRDCADRRFNRHSMGNVEEWSVDRRRSMLIPSLTRSRLARRCCACGVTVIVIPLATGPAPQDQSRDHPKSFNYAAAGPQNVLSSSLEHDGPDRLGTPARLWAAASLYDPRSVALHMVSSF